MAGGCFQAFVPKGALGLPDIDARQLRAYKAPEVMGFHIVESGRLGVIADDLPNSRGRHGTRSQAVATTVEGREDILAGNRSLG